MKRIKNKGFTLVELLAVIVVLAIIMVIAVPAVTSSLNKAKKSSFLIYAEKMLNAAEQQYRTDELDSSMPSTYCYNIEYLSGGKSSTYKGFVKVVVDDYETKTSISMFDKNYSIGITTSGVASGISFSAIEELKNNSSSTISKGGNFTLKSPCNESNTKGDPKVVGKEDSSSNSSVTGTNAALYINDLYKNSAKDNTSELYQDATNDKNIRYVSALVNANDEDYNSERKNPDNYVEFNDELYRIIGLFNNVYDVDNGSNTSAIKIVKASPYGSEAQRYDKYNTDVFEWKDTELQKYLNNDYYNNLNADSKNMIMKARWYITKTGSPGNGDTIKNFYTYEKNGDANKTLDYFDANIGLLGATDLTYISTYYLENSVTVLQLFQYVRKNNNWLLDGIGEIKKDYLVMFTMSIVDNYGAWCWYFDNWRSEGITNLMVTADAISGEVYPSLYLKSDVKIIGGNGTQGDPYILDL